MKTLTLDEIENLFDEAEKKFLENSSQILQSKVTSILGKLSDESNRFGIDVIEGIRRYFSVSLSEEERDKYYTFYFYLTALSNCLRNEQKSKTV